MGRQSYVWVLLLPLLPGLALFLRRFMLMKERRGEGRESLAGSYTVTSFIESSGIYMFNYTTENVNKRGKIFILFHLIYCIIKASSDRGVYIRNNMSINPDAGERKKCKSCQLQVKSLKASVLSVNCRLLNTQ